MIEVKNPLQPGTALILLEDVVSPMTSKGKVKTKYGVKNDKVTLITDHHYPVLIVENIRLERFPVRVEKVKKQQSFTK